MSLDAAPDPSLLVLDGAAQDLVLRDARTPKKFLPDPVDETQLSTVVDLARWGPTMTNAQPLRVVLARTDDAKGQVLERLFPYNRERAGDAPVLAVFCADHAFDRHLDRIFPGAAMIAQAYRDDDAFRSRVADSQAWMQAGYWILSIRAVGLDVLPMMGFDATAMDEFLRATQESLFAGSDLRSIMVAAIGRAAPDSYPPRPPRLEPDEIVADL